MPKFKFDKLVRDKIIDHQIASGAMPHYRRLSPAQHKIELVRKIIEEAREILQAKESDVASEIADVQQVIDDLKEQYNLTDNDIASAQEAKHDKNGAFKAGVFIDYVELDESSEWAAYYRQNADRYPEIT